MSLERMAVIIRLRFRSLLRRRQVEQELADEFQDHLDMKAREYVSVGMTIEQARHAAMRDMGGIERHKEACRDVRRVSVIEHVAQDLRYAVRVLWTSPVFAVVSILVLALGIGGVTTMYAALDAVVLQPLPFDEPDRLVSVSSVDPSGRRNTVSALDYEDYRRGCDAFESLAAYVPFQRPALLTGAAEVERLTSTFVSHNFFATLRVSPGWGRGFVAGDEQAGATDVVIVSYGLWQRKFGGAGEALGSIVLLDNRPFEIVGIMPARFEFPRQIDVWLPMRQGLGVTSTRSNRNFSVFGRLAGGATIDKARAQALAVAVRGAEVYPDTNIGWGVRLQPMHEVLFGQYRLAMVILLGAVTLLHLVACGNLSSLFLARASARTGEFAMRAALGATRVRLLSQLLTESLVTAIIGGGLGIWLARMGIATVRAMAPPTLPRTGDIGIGLTSVAFTATVTILTGLAIGWVPAWRATSGNLFQSVRTAGRVGGASSTLRLRSALVVLQVAMSMILVAGSGLLIRSFLRLQRVDPGFRPENLLLAEVRFPLLRYDTDEKLVDILDQLQQRVSALPGILAVGGSERFPFVPGGFTNDVYPGRPPQANEPWKDALRYRATADFFDVLRIPILAGRSFERRDGLGASPVVIVNNTMARTFWPGENALHKTLALSWNDPEPLVLEVVGIAADVRESGPDSQDRPVFYLHAAQFPIVSAQLAIRTHADAPTLAATIRNAVRELDRNIPISGFHTMDSRHAERVALPRFQTWLLGTFAALALVIATLGLYGVLSYLVSQTRREIGIRMALGASTTRVTGLIVRKGMCLAGTGIVLGLAGALAGGGLVRSLLFLTAPSDTTTFVAATSGLLTTALLACLLPARHAARVNPAVALRSE